MHAPLHAIVAILFSLALIGALADHSSVHLLPIEQSPDTNIAYKTSTALLQVSTTVPAYSVFEHVRDIQSHDVVLKTIKKVEIAWNYNQDGILANARYALRRVLPVGNTTMFVSFKVPNTASSVAKTMPDFILAAISRLVAPYIGEKDAQDMQESLPHCAWVNPPSFFDNTVGLLCAWNDIRFGLESGVVDRRTWSSTDGNGASEAVLERITFLKQEDSATLWTYNVTTYSYDPQDKKHLSKFNVTYILESKLTKGTFALSESSEPNAELVKTSGVLPKSIKLHPYNLERTLAKNGMHRELVTRVTHKQITPPTNRISCRLASIEVLDEDFFVDQYEVEENARFGGPNVTIYREIDLEKPSFLSTQNVLIVSSPIQWDHTEATLSLPVHFRYQRPTLDDPFVPVTIREPQVIMMCAVNTSRAPPPPDPAFVTALLTGTVPSLPSSLFLITFINKASPAVIDTLWPTGLWQDADLVKLVTFLVTVAMSLLTIVAIVFKNRPTPHPK